MYEQYFRVEIEVIQLLFKVKKKELLTKHPVNRPQMKTQLRCPVLTSSACLLLKCVNLLLPGCFFFVFLKNFLPVALPPLTLARINTHKARIRSQMHRLKQTCLRCEAVNNHPGWSRHSAAVTFQRGFAKKNPHIVMYLCQRHTCRMTH